MRMWKSLPALVLTLRRAHWQGQMNSGKVRFVSYVNFEKITDLEEHRVEPKEILELKHGAAQQASAANF